jgi:transposase
MRKMNRVVEKVNAHVAGLDVHKLRITYCILDREGNEEASGEIAADRESLRAFVEEHVGGREFHFALEASGYAIWVYDLLVEACGRERVHVAHAAHVRAIANSPRKNDANDAYWLAYLTHERRLPEARLPAGELRELRLATRHRIRIVRRQTGLKARIRGVLAQVGYRIAHKLDSRRGRARMEEVLASGELTATRTECLRDLVEEMDRQEELVRKWEERIGKLVESLPEVEAMRREIPGFGAVIAPAVYAETGDPRRFSSAKALGGYTGLVPTDRSTGGKTRHGHMTRAGSPFLRWALVEAVVACQKARRGPAKAVGEWVRRRQARMGDKKRAQCAAARKLAEATWRLFSYGEVFDVARAFGR